MVIRPEFPVDCTDNLITWGVLTDRGPASLIFGTTCSIWYLVVVYDSHELRVETLADRPFPDVHAEMHRAGAFDIDIDGELAIGVDGGSMTPLVIRAGRYVHRDAPHEAFDCSALGVFYPALAGLGRQAERLRARAESLLAVPDTWPAGVAGTAAVGTTLGCALALAVAHPAGGPSLAELLVAGCGAGGIGGLLAGVVVG